MSVTSKARRFEFSEGNSDKFWTINIAGTAVTVHFGRIGTNGQTQTKSFPDQEAATKHGEKMIASKLTKGYEEVK